MREWIGLVWLRKDISGGRIMVSRYAGNSCHMDLPITLVSEEGRCCMDRMNELLILDGY